MLQQLKSAGVPALPGRTAASLLSCCCSGPWCSLAGCPWTWGCNVPEEGPSVSGNEWDGEMESRKRAWAEGCDATRGALRAGVGRAPVGGRLDKGWGR